MFLLFCCLKSPKRKPYVWQRGPKTPIIKHAILGVRQKCGRDHARSSTAKKYGLCSSQNISWRHARQVRMGDRSSCWTGQGQHEEKMVRSTSLVSGRQRQRHEKKNTSPTRAARRRLMTRNSLLMGGDESIATATGLAMRKQIVTAGVSQDRVGAASPASKACERIASFGCHIRSRKAPHPSCGFPLES